MAEADLMFSNALVSAIGWALVHFLWQGCAIAALYWLVCVLSRRESAHLRYRAGIAGFVLSLAALLITFAVYFKPDARFAALPTSEQSVNHFLVLSGSIPDSWALIQDGLEPALPLIVMIWLVGAIIHLAGTVCGWVGIQRLIRSGDPDIGEHLRSAVTELARTLAVSRAVRVMKSSLVTVPMAIGWLKPIILLPASVMVSLPRDQLEMIVAHELGHIKRFDYLLNLLQIVLETLLYYHPAIAWMSRRVRDEREKCCDDLVVSRCRKPATYARALANLEVMRSPVTVAALSATGGDLMGRIRRIVDHELPRTSSGYVQVSLLAVVALMVVLATHQGLLMSRALNQVAGTARVQASDVEWEIWGQSRAAWGEGVRDYARRLADRAATPATGDTISSLMTAKVGVTESSGTAAGQQLVQQAPVAISPGVEKFAQTAIPLLSRNPVTPLDSIDVAAMGSAPAALTEEVFMPLERLAEDPAKTQLSPTQDAQTVDRKSMVVPLVKPAPKYPWRARARGVEGFVELAFSVDRQGRVTEVEVVDSLPSGTFERVARKALQKWRFAPPGEGEQTARFVQTFDFNLTDKVEAPPPARDCVSSGRRACRQFPSAAVIVYVNPPEPTTAIDSVN